MYLTGWERAQVCQATDSIRVWWYCLSHWCQLQKLLWSRHSNFKPSFDYKCRQSKESLFILLIAEVFFSCLLFQPFSFLSFLWHRDFPWLLKLFFPFSLQILIRFSLLLRSISQIKTSCSIFYFKIKCMHLIMPLDNSVFFFFFALFSLT